jgi:hypothetical protein
VTYPGKAIKWMRGFTSPTQPRNEVDARIHLAKPEVDARIHLAQT